ncbi:MAG TPA: caspase family protein [Chitinophagaceae bacterium]|nr:caspase family protein [Chitinophagaceae bacterium]
MRITSSLLYFLIAIKLSAQGPKLILPVSHSYEIKYAVFSPDSKLILTVADGGKIWDVATGRLLTNIRKLEYGAKFSGDGKKIFHGAKAWDVYSGEEIINLSGQVLAANYPDLAKKNESRDSLHKRLGKLLSELKGSLWYSDKYGQIQIGKASFFPSGKKLMVQNRKVIVWDVITGDSLFEIHPKNENEVFNASFSSDGTKIFASSLKEIIIVDAESGQLIQKFASGRGPVAFSNQGDKLIQDNIIRKIGDQNAIVPLKLKIKTTVLSYQFSPDDKFILAILPSQDTAVLFDAITGKQQHIFPYTNSIYSEPFFSADSKALVVGFTAWDLRTGKKIIDIAITERGTRSFTALSPDRKFLAAGFYLTNSADLYNVESGQLITKLKGFTPNVNTAIFSPDRKTIVTAGENDFMRIWNAGSGVMVKKLSYPINGRVSLTYSADSTKLLVTSEQENIGRLLDATSFDIIQELKGHEAGIASSAISPDCKMLVTAGRDKTVRVWNTETGEMIRSIGNYAAGMVNYVAFGPGSGMITTGSYEGLLKIWNINTGAFIREIPNNSSKVEYISFSPDRTRLAIVTMGGVCRILNLQTGEPLFYLDGIVKTVSFSNDGEKILTGNNNSLIRLHNAHTGKVEKEIIIPGNRVAFFSADNERIITAASGEMMEIYSYPDLQLIYKFLPVDTTDYFLQIATQYYLSTPSAAKVLHYVSKNLKIISFEQLDVKYNRPDKVLEAIGNTDTALIKSYRKAWEKRIKKLGIDTTQFREGYSVPECDFVNRDQIDAEQKTETLRLHIKANDSTYLLDRFNVWINESPLFGQRGISIRKNNSYSLDTIITIKLSQGENRFECSITNINGTESYRMPLYVNYTPVVKQKESLRFIGIGIDRFSEKGHDLQYSVKDIRDLSAKLKEKYGNDIQIDTLFNENVNSSNVSALKKQLQQTSVNDKVILAYSGHGLLSKEYDYYLSTYTVNFDNPEINGLPYEELENLLDSIPARRKLMLIDACHSGEVDKEEMTRITDASDSLQQLGTKGGKPTYTDKTTLGMKNSFELMQSLFVNVGKSTGATVISAAAGTQFALERGDLKNGVFTYSILEAMNKYPSIKISELRRIVGERVEKLTNGLQKPTSRNETITSDWTL